jgi:hypothetical protein
MIELLSLFAFEVLAAMVLLWLPSFILRRFK